MDEIAHHVWQTKYRYKEDSHLRDETIEDTWRRVARVIAAVEPHDREWWQNKFFEILKGCKFLPGGRILAGAGTGRRVTLFNCFVMGIIEDSLPGILGALSEGTLTLQQGGGVGYDFSTLRPKGMHAKGVGAIASGPVSFMPIWDAMSETLMSTGPRRAAIMGTLRCDPQTSKHLSAPSVSPAGCGISIFRSRLPTLLWRRCATMRSAADFSDRGRQQ